MLAWIRRLQVAATGLWWSWLPSALFWRWQSVCVAASAAQLPSWPAHIHCILVSTGSIAGGVGIKLAGTDSPPSLPAPPLLPCSLEGKEEFMRHVAGCLRPEGMYVVIDMFRAEGESREGYMARFKQHMDAQLSGRPWVGGLALVVIFGWAPGRHGTS